MFIKCGMWSADGNKDWKISGSLANKSTVGLPLYVSNGMENTAMDRRGQGAGRG